MCVYLYNKYDIYSTLESCVTKNVIRNKFYIKTIFIFILLKLSYKCLMLFLSKNNVYNL